MSYLVHAVDDGQAVIEYFNGVGKYADRAGYPEPHVLVLDLKMPLRSGFDVLKWVRSKPQFRNLPIVVMNSSALERDVKLAYDLGASSYLVKPNGLKGYERLMAILLEYWDRVSTPHRLGRRIQADA